MKKFIRDNPTLAFGLGLPLLIVLVFMVAAMLPRIGAITPKYAVVFATNYTPNQYPGQRGVVIRIENKKAHVVYIGENNYYNVPKLYLFDPAKDSIREIPITLPLSLTTTCVYKVQADCSQHDSAKITPISVPELEPLQLDASTIAPDGYEFTNYYDSYSRDPFFGGLFFGSSYHSGVALKKGSYSVEVPHTEPYGNAQFIGWVTQ